MTDGQSDYDRDGYKVWHMVWYLSYFFFAESVRASEVNGMQNYNKESCFQF